MSAEEHDEDRRAIASEEEKMQRLRKCVRDAPSSIRQRRFWLLAAMCGATGVLGAAWIGGMRLALAIAVAVFLIICIELVSRVDDPELAAAKAKLREQKNFVHGRKKRVGLGAADDVRR